MKTKSKNYFTFFISLFFVLMMLSACTSLDEKNPACTGKDRWDVKTLTDSKTAKIDYAAELTTIKQLISIPLNETIEDHTARFGIELKSYTLQCHIREYKLSDDGDYHLVLQDLVDPTITMIGEIPDPYCESVKSSVHFNDIIKAREDFKNSLLVTAQADTSIYTITGIAFYDKVHGQLGAAPNAIEIHPILFISKK